MKKQLFKWVYVPLVVELFFGVLWWICVWALQILLFVVQFGLEINL